MTTTPDTEAYVRRSDAYWRQALEYLPRRELEKASELAWGSVVERVKALALARTGAELRSHRELREYIKRVANQALDEELFRDYREAESLHINFYEFLFDVQEVTVALDIVRRLLAKIDSYLEGTA